MTLTWLAITLARRGEVMYREAAAVRTARLGAQNVLTTEATAKLERVRAGRR